MTKETCRKYFAVLIVLVFSFTVWGEQLSAERIARNKAIADIRMGDFSVRVTDVDGSVGAGATVTFEQQKHDFHFGNAMNLSAFSDSKYLDTMAAYFNQAGMQWEFEWDETEPRRDQVTFQYAKQVCAWAKAMGLTARAHAFGWGTTTYGNVPTWQIGLSKSELVEEMLERCWDVYENFGDTSFTDYDILNELTASYCGFYQDEAGYDGIAAMYNLADSLFTGEVYVNEFDIIGGSAGSRLRNVMDDIIDEGGVIQGVGMQAHVMSNETTQDVIDAMDAFDSYGVRTKVTEAIFGGSDNAQADCMEEILVGCFSHTSCDGFMTWGVQQSEMTYSTSNHWWDSNWNPRPVVKRYKDLVFDEWWSENESETTGSNGIATGDVFYGTYLITVSAPGNAEQKTVTATMTRDEGEKQIEVQLDGEYWSSSVAPEKNGSHSALQVNAVPKSDMVEFIIRNGNTYNTNISVYNVKGEKVWGRSVKNQYKVTWNHGAAQRISSGTYFVRADVGGQRLQQRFVVLR